MPFREPLVELAFANELHEWWRYACPSVPIEKVQEIVQLKLHNSLEGQKGCDVFYTQIDIPKGNGRTRRIHAPHETLKEEQRNLVYDIGYAYLPEHIAAFRKHYSAIRGVRELLNRFRKEAGHNAWIKSLYQVDIKDFFPSITVEQIREAMRARVDDLCLTFPLKEMKNEANRELCTDVFTELTSFQGHLPQGAPTSPFISNMVGRNFDEPIEKLLKEKCGPETQYWRYADDCVIASGEPLPETIRHQILSMIQQAGFQPSQHKIKYEEGRRNYNIWGIDVLPPTEKSRGFMRMRLPQARVKEYRSKLIGLVKDAETLSVSPNFMNEKRVQQALGCVSYARQIGGESFDTVDRKTGLPERLDHAWKLFLKTYKHKLKGKYVGMEHKRMVRVDRELFDFFVRGLCTIDPADPNAAAHAYLVGTDPDELDEELAWFRESLQKEFPIAEPGMPHKNEHDQYAYSKVAYDLKYLHNDLQFRPKNMQTNRPLFDRPDPKQKPLIDPRRADRVRTVFLQTIAYTQLELSGEFFETNKRPTHLLPKAILKPWMEFLADLNEYAGPKVGKRYRTLFWPIRELPEAWDEDWQET